MSDLLHQNLATVQSNLQPAPVTVASTTTISPSTFVTFVSGTVQITTVTPPVTGQHLLVLIPTGQFTTVTTGNLSVATTAVVGDPLLLFYNPLEAKYYVKV